MNARFAFVLPALVLAALAVEPPPIAAPAQTREIRIAGYPELAPVIARWADAFAKIRPEVRVTTHLTGSDTGMAALYTGRADLTLLGRAPTPSEIQAFEWIHRYKPPQIELLTGSLDRPGRSPALVLFVHRDNPLASLSLAQLDAIFGTEHRMAPANIRTWDQLGLGGEWSGRALRLYAPDAMSGTGRFFRRVVLADSRMMNWEQLTEFADTAPTLHPSHDAGRRALAALAQDRFGLAVASLGDRHDGVRALPLVVDGREVAATRENLLTRAYPLTRAVVGCFHRQPGAKTDPALAEFLRFALSAEGQRLAHETDTYLPLSAELAAEQARRLD